MAVVNAAFTGDEGLVRLCGLWRPRSPGDAAYPPMARQRRGAAGSIRLRHSRSTCSMCSEPHWRPHRIHAMPARFEVPQLCHILLRLFVQGGVYAKLTMVKWRRWGRGCFSVQVRLRPSLVDCDSRTPLKLHFPLRWTHLQQKRQFLENLRRASSLYRWTCTGVVHVTLGVCAPKSAVAGHHRCQCRRPATSSCLPPA